MGIMVNAVDRAFSEGRSSPAVQNGVSDAERTNEKAKDNFDPFACLFRQKIEKLIDADARSDNTKFLAYFKEAKARKNVEDLFDAAKTGDKSQVFSAIKNGDGVPLDQPITTAYPLTTYNVDDSGIYEGTIDYIIQKQQ